MLICDGFGTHETLEILEFCFENKITLCRLPSLTEACTIGFRFFFYATLYYRSSGKYKSSTDQSMSTM
ncbi:hypothetical protein EJ04DRAFT_512420, partial [Polyplosphaeria fusca]